MEDNVKRIHSGMPLSKSLLPRLISSSSEEFNLELSESLTFISKFIYIHEYSILPILETLKCNKSENIKLL